MPETGLIITAEDKATAVMKKVGSQGKEALGGITSSSKKTSEMVNRLPEQFGKASSAIMLLQGSTASLGGEAAKALTQLTGLGAIIATGGPVGIAIAAATVAVVVITEAWEMFTSEVRAAKAEQRALDRVFATSIERLDDLKKGVMELSDEVRFYGQDSLTVAILKQWELVEANKRGLASIDAELDALRLSSVAVENLSDAERSHMANLIKIRDGAREVLIEREKALDQLETLAVKQAEREEVIEREKKATERAGKADKDRNDALREYAKLFVLRTELGERMGARAVESTRRNLELEADLYEEQARFIDAQLQKRLDKQIEIGTQITTVTMSIAEASIDTILNTTQTVEEKLKALGMTVVQIAKRTILELVTAEIIALITKKLAKKSEAIGSITANAGMAASGAAAATAPIPIVGPALAPVVAAETFATTVAYIAPAVAALRTGGVLGGSGPVDSALARLTPGKERVLSERQTSSFEDFVKLLGSIVSQPPRMAMAGGPQINNFDMRSFIPRRGVEMQRSVIEVNKTQKKLQRRGRIK